MNARATRQDRFMLSPDGMDANWVNPGEIATRCPNWTDCTDMDNEAFQRLVGQRQSDPRIVGLTMCAPARSIQTSAEV